MTALKRKEKIVANNVVSSLYNPSATLHQLRLYPSRTPIQCVALHLKTDSLLHESAFIRVSTLACEMLDAK